MFSTRLNKRGVIGDYIFMIYRLVLITIVATVIVGICSTAYSLNINVRDSEARILAHETIECLIEKDVLSKPQSVIDEIKYNILDYCSITGDLSRYYISLTYEKDSEKIVLEQGDSGLTFVREIVDALGSEFGKSDFAKYQPGYYNNHFVIDGVGVIFEVFVNEN